MAEVELRSDVASLGLLAAINILADVLVTHYPHLQPEIEMRAQRKLSEWRADPATAPHAESLALVLRALTRSARALERKPPAGQA